LFVTEVENLSVDGCGNGTVAKKGRALTLVNAAAKSDGGMERSWLILWQEDAKG